MAGKTTAATKADAIEVAVTQPNPNEEIAELRKMISDMQTQQREQEARANVTAATVSGSNAHVMKRLEEVSDAQRSDYQKTINAAKRDTRRRLRLNGRTHHTWKPVHPDYEGMTGVVRVDNRRLQAERLRKKAQAMIDGGDFNSDLIS